MAEPGCGSAWDLFMADEEWKKIMKVTSAQHGVLVGEIEDRMLTPTSYSPVIHRTETIRNESD